MNLIWVRILIGLGGAAFLGLGALFGWITAKTWHRVGWSHRTARAYLLARTTTTAAVGVSFSVAAVFAARDAALAAAVALIVGFVASTLLARRV